MVVAAVWPVHLVEIDMISLQPLQANLQRLAHRLRAGGRAAVDIRAAGTGDLGGDDDVVALAALLQPCADIVFGETHGFRTGRGHRIKFGGIEEVDAPADGIIHLLMRFRLAVLRAPGHCAQADFRNLDAGAAECVVFHGASRASNCVRRRM